MATFFYRWPDGSISVVTAASKDHAVLLLDELGSIEPREIKRLRSSFMVTLRPSIKNGWALDLNATPLGRESDSEILARCFPHYNKILEELYEGDWDGNEETLRAEERARLEAAIEEDATEAEILAKKRTSHPVVIKMLRQKRIRKN